MGGWGWAGWGWESGWFGLGGWPPPHSPATPPPPHTRTRPATGHPTKPATWSPQPSDPNHPPQGAWPCMGCQPAAAPMHTHTHCDAPRPLPSPTHRGDGVYSKHNIGQLHHQQHKQQRRRHAHAVLHTDSHTSPAHSARQFCTEGKASAEGRCQGNVGAAQPPHSVPTFVWHRFTCMVKNLSPSYESVNDMRDLQNCTILFLLKSSSSSSSPPALHGQQRVTIKMGGGKSPGG